MAQNTDHTSNNASTKTGHERYEYRVWGKHPSAREEIERLATSDEIREQIDDCYLLVDDSDWNAKVRDSQLKLKHRTPDNRGFDQWDTQWCTASDTTPTPFDTVFEQLRLDRPQRGKTYDLERAVENLDETQAVAVFVTKKRRTWNIGDMRAEISRVDLRDHDVRLHSVAVQGRDVERLTQLLEQLGLDGLPNVPMHLAVLDETVLA